MDGLTIRKLKIADADSISRIHRAITKAEENADLRLLVEDQIVKTENVNFVAEYEGAVVGYMFSYMLHAGFGVNRSAWITMMEVDPGFMGQGIGRKLAEEIFKVYREQGVEDIYSSVRWDSTDLLSFFKTLGFERSDFINLKAELRSNPNDATK